MKVEGKTYLRVLPNGESREASDTERESAFAERGRLSKLRRNIKRAENKVARILDECQHEVRYRREHKGFDFERCVACSQDFIVLEDHKLEWCQQQQPLDWGTPNETQA